MPSQTELLAALGLVEEVTGITKFCIHPEKWFREKQRVGGTKTVNLEKIASLQPDLILANKEENVKEQVDALAKNFPVWVSDISTLDEALAMMKSVGEITGRLEKASSLVEQIRSEFAQLKVLNSSAEVSVGPDIKRQPPNFKTQTAYLIWKDPYMTICSDTFIHDMMCRAGFDNVFGDRLRYPQITLDELQAKNCDLLFLSSEPYPFGQKHIAELQPYLPTTKILLVDGEMFSWYGSRLLKAASYFKSLQAQINGLL